MIALNKLSVISGSRAEFKIWNYPATEKLEELDKPNFFDPALVMFAAGDMIRIFHYSLENELDAVITYVVSYANKEENVIKVEKLFVQDLKSKAQIQETTKNVVDKMIKDAKKEIEELIKEELEKALTQLKEQGEK